MKKILIVDDSIDNISLAKYVLNEEFDCFVATSGFEALDLVKNIPFDLIISDYQMENGDGLWLLKQLNLISKAPPCLILTADLSKDHTFFFDAGAQGFCPKYRMMDLLVNEVRRILD
jgi:CheY-like chemotaxis protein